MTVYRCVMMLVLKMKMSKYNIICFLKKVIYMPLISSRNWTKWIGFMQEIVFPWRIQYIQYIDIPVNYLDCIALII